MVRRGPAQPAGGRISRRPPASERRIRTQRTRSLSVRSRGAPPSAEGAAAVSPAASLQHPRPLSCAPGTLPFQNGALQHIRRRRPSPGSILPRRSGTRPKVASRGLAVPRPPIPPDTRLGETGCCSPRKQVRPSPAAEKTPVATEAPPRTRRSGGMCERGSTPFHRIVTQKPKSLPPAAVRIPGAQRRAVRGRGAPTPPTRGQDAGTPPTAEESEPRPWPEKHLLRPKLRFGRGTCGGMCERGSTPFHRIVTQKPKSLPPAAVRIPGAQRRAVRGRGAPTPPTRGQDAGTPPTPAESTPVRGPKKHLLRPKLRFGRGTAGVWVKGGPPPFTES